MRTASLHTLLPRGIPTASGALHRHAVLRPLSGADELLLAERPPGPEEVSALLARQLVRVGALRDISIAHAAAMTRGDRDHLLLMLRVGVCGDALHLTVRCGSPSCASAVPLTLRISELTMAPLRSAPGRFRVPTSAGLAVLREPTGEDDALLDGTTDEARLWSRLVLRLGERAALTPEDWQALPAAVQRTLALGLARHRRGPRLRGQEDCPACGAWVEWRIDPAALLSAELRAGAQRLPEEVHALAWHYHWSEEAILALPRSRRWRYLALLRAALEEAP